MKEQDSGYWMTDTISSTDTSLKYVWVSQNSLTVKYNSVFSDVSAMALLAGRGIKPVQRLQQFPKFWFRGTGI